jgi:hypothetical protein
MTHAYDLGITHKRAADQLRISDAMTNVHLHPPARCAEEVWTACRGRHGMRSALGGWFFYRNLVLKLLSVV